MKKRIILALIVLVLFIGLTQLFIVDKDRTSILDKEEFLMIAHRGASLHAPEHTLESYNLARKNKADYLEIDLQMTSDDALVAMHDEKVDRTTNGTGEVSHLTLDEIKQLDAGKRFNDSFEGLSVPTLNEIFQEFNNNVNYYIETKQPKNDFKMEKSLINSLEKYKLLENASNGSVVIQSFSEESLRKIKEMNDEIPLIQLQDYKNEATITNKELDQISEYAVGLGVNYKSLTQKFVDKVSNYGMVIHAYTVNKSNEIKKLELMGVNGAFTDNKELYEE